MVTRAAAEAAMAEVETAEEQVLVAEARAGLAEEASERAQQAAEEAKPVGTNWLLVIGAAVVAFVVGAGLIWAYDDDVRRGKAEE